MRLCVVFTVFLLTVCHTVVAAPKLKHVVFLLADDGGRELKAYGNNVSVTPNLDALGANGTVFDRAYSTVSSCSPSRSALLTGMPTHQNGILGLDQNLGRWNVFDDTVSLPNFLNDHGYKTGILGKYHVGSLGHFNFSYGVNPPYCWSGAGNINPACHTDYNTVTRNVTMMKQNLQTFLQQEPDKPFFLYVGFGDTHRCGFESTIGSFCEFYGSGERGQGVIPDWTPNFFAPEDVVVPPYLPDIPDVREDLAAMYTAQQRLDTGVGLILAELQAAGVLDDCLVIYTSDNGIPFPSGKTNLAYEQGAIEPLIIRDFTVDAGRQPARSSLVTSSLDYLPTILDFLELPLPPHKTYTGQSLLPAVRGTLPLGAEWEAYGSHQFHSLPLYYPMRSVTNSTHRLVQNLAPDLAFGILMDVYSTSTWKKLMNGSVHWVYNFTRYKHRPPLQLFDVVTDPLCIDNLADTDLPSVAHLQARLQQWRTVTDDKWLQCFDNPGFCSQ